MAACATCRHYKLALVYESLRERRILMDIADDIVKPNWFYLPVYKTDRFAAWQVRLGLILYRILAGRKNLAGFKQLPREQWHQLEGLKHLWSRVCFRLPRRTDR